MWTRLDWAEECWHKCKKSGEKSHNSFKPLSYDDDKVASVDGAQQQLRKLSTGHNARRPRTQAVGNHHHF